MSAFVLKIIAIICMFIDHFGASFENVFDTDNLRAIGRVTFPIFAFFIAEGCKHTRNIKKYALRLFLFALISEIPFDIMGERSNWLDFSSQNVMVTFFLAVVAVFVYQKLVLARQEEALKAFFLGIVLVIICLLGDVLKTDYGTIGVTSVLLLYITHDRLKQSIILLIMCFLTYIGFLIGAQFMMFFKLMLFSTVSIALIYFYNGERGRPLKWLFYAFYPLHMIVIDVIYNIWKR